MRALVIISVLCIGWTLYVASARADATYNVHPTMGAIIEDNHTPCGPDVRAWLEQFVGGLQIIVVGNRKHIAITYAGTTRSPDYEIDGDPLLGFWRQSQKTIYVALRGDENPRVDVAFIVRDTDSVCYERWEGLGLRR